ncbi:hypothetical protein JKP88DRAFT_275826 [Tribonema minus]|uniref:Uncharacterized protein n=1 Tax=Tribonema minus TaxID=303371 RepID=A0A835ZAH1_9STRA|nr:hypothetical protein JKP88DRAFT_275826 [Tribonema minus]
MIADRYGDGDGDDRDGCGGGSSSARRESRPPTPSAQCSPPPSPAGGLDAVTACEAVASLPEAARSYLLVPLRYGIAGVPPGHVQHASCASVTREAVTSWTGLEGATEALRRRFDAEAAACGARGAAPSAYFMTPRGDAPSAAPAPATSVVECVLKGLAQMALARVLPERPVRPGDATRARGLYSAVRDASGAIAEAGLLPQRVAGLAAAALQAMAASETVEAAAVRLATLDVGSALAALAAAAEAEADPEGRAARAEPSTAAPRPPLSSRGLSADAAPFAPASAPRALSH